VLEDSFLECVAIVSGGAVEDLLADALAHGFLKSVSVEGVEEGEVG